MKKHILLFCILTVLIQNVQLSGQGFDNYKFCSRIAIDDADTFANKGAGIAFNPVDSTFIICQSSPETLYVVDMDGTLLSTNPLIGFADVEGLEIIDENTFVLVEEYKRGNIIFLPLPIPTNQSIHYPNSTQIIHAPDSNLIFQCPSIETVSCPETGEMIECTDLNQIIQCPHGNNGFESIAYDATNDILYWAKERDPITVFSLENPRSYASNNDTLYATSPWDINAEIDTALIDFMGTDDPDSLDENADIDLFWDIKNFEDIGGMHFSSSNTLWIISEDRNIDIMMELDPIKGDVLNIFKFNGPNMNKLQGITEGPSGEIIVIDHWSLYMNKFDDDCVVYNDCPANASVFFDFEQGMDLCNLEEVNFSHWRRQQQEWIDNDVTKIEGAANGDYYFLLEEGDPIYYTSADNGGTAEGPEIDLEGIIDPVIKFDYTLDNFTLELYISEDDGNTWEIAWDETAPYSNATTFPLEWNQMIIPLDNYIDKKIKFRFQAIKGRNNLTRPTFNAISALDAIEFGSEDVITCNDVDNDGICEEDDCDNNNPNVPTILGMSCDDGNPDTSGDFILPDGCTCIGYYPCEPFYELSGTINPGIFRAQDYIQSDGQIPAGGTVYFIASNRVDLLPGFDADSSADTEFTADLNQICPANKQETESELSTIRNYPNPFTGQTTIEFTLPEDSPVTLWVTDAMGRQIAVLKDGESTPAGTHEVNFDGSNYAARMYYYTIQAGEYIGTQKMILLK